MRGTLHLFSITDLPLYVAARDWQPTGTWANYFAEVGLSRGQQEAYLAAIPQVLEEGPLTRVQLADAVAKHTGVARTRDFILSSSWGTPFWWGCSKTQAKALFHSLQHELEELEEVEVEGWRAFVLHSTLPLLERAEPVEHIHLLPLFDAYTIGVPRDCVPLLAPIYKRRVFNLQGWTFAVILVNGSIQGLWHYTVQRTQTNVKVSLFSPPTASIRKGIDAEAARLSSFFGKQVVLEYEDALSAVDV